MEMRNPWGQGGMEWNGDWSDKSPLWTEEIKVLYMLIPAVYVNACCLLFCFVFVTSCISNIDNDNDDDCIKYNQPSYRCGVQHVLLRFYVQNFKTSRSPPSQTTH